MRRKAQREAELAWEHEHPERADDERYRREVLPNLAGRSTLEISRMTGMSVAYCAKLKRGELIPHPRLWGSLDRCLSAR